jgi:hypothetical protein
MKTRTLLATWAVFLIACGSSTDALRPEPAQEFIIEVSNERFRIRTTNPAIATQLNQRRMSATIGVVSGRLVRGNGGFNEPWSWHLDPASIEVPDVSMELCDGRPSMVQSDLDYWVDTVHVYCPWGARVYDAQ